ncbi:Caudovirales tail fiber assembly protein [compost metagenome]
MATNAAKRDSFLRDAATRIAPLQDAVDLGVATPAEQSALLSWKQYRVALNRLDLSASTIDWPAEPV